MCDAEASALAAASVGSGRASPADELDDASALYCETHSQEEPLVDDDKTSSTASSNENDDVSFTILDLPTEVFLHICSFLDASTLVHKLSLTCKQFYEILNDVSIWKVRAGRVWPNSTYPMLPPVEDDECFWKLSCVGLERQSKLWRNRKYKLERILLNSIHCSPIDGLKLMHGGRICISGGRDRSLVMSTLPEEDDDAETIKNLGAHGGWIFGVTAMYDTVYSCSWDRSVKIWSVTTGLSAITSYDMVVNGALLCITACPEVELFATGSYCKSVIVFDPRSGHIPIVKYQPHQRAVLKVNMNSNYIVSASEDKTVNIWDLRTRKSLKLITISKDSFPMSLCIHKNYVYVGDSGASLHILDEKKDFEIVKSYKTEHEKKITGVYVDAGCIITSSLDKSVHVSSPTNPPQPMALLNHYGEVASIDYLNEVLAIAGSDSIEIWRPMNGI